MEENVLSDPTKQSEKEEDCTNRKDDKDRCESEWTFNMTKCADALEEGTCPHKKDLEEDEEEFEDAKDISGEYIEYDEEHLKETFKDMSDEQLEECRLKSVKLKEDGNQEFKSKNFSDALNLYTQAINSCPLQFTQERSVLFANRAASLINMERNQEALNDCHKALELNPDYFKVLLRRAQLHRKMDNLDQSLEDYKKILEMDRGNHEARQACMTLPGEINERNEKLKTEMLGKLKDLGNLVLRPFGLSTNNFNVAQDPKSGGYSINFQNNPK